MVDAALQARLVDVDDEHDALVHGDGERLRAAHAARAAGQGQGAGEGSPPDTRFAGGDCAANVSYVPCRMPCVPM